MRMQDIFGKHTGYLREIHGTYHKGNSPPVFDKHYDKIQCRHCVFLPCVVCDSTVFSVTGDSTVFSVPGDSTVF